MRRNVVPRALAVLAGAALLALFVRPLITSGFDAVPGDLGDSLLNLYTLEHWYRWVALGQGHWRASTAFFPLTNTLGYTDALFLLALPFGVARFAGAELVAAYQLALVVSLATGFTGFYYLLRHEFGLGRTPTLIGCTLAFLNNGFYVSVTHTQLFAIGVIPFLLIALVRFFRRTDRTIRERLPWGAVAAVLLPLLLYTGYYVGWFSLFFLMLLAGTYLVYDQLTAGGRARVGCVKWAVGHKLELITYLLLFVAALCPFALTYLPILRETGGRPFEVALSTLPQWFDFINVGPGNALWGNALSRAFPYADARPLSWELVKGVPLITFAAFVVAAAGLWREIVSARADGVPHLRTPGEEPAPASPVILAAITAATVVVAWALQLRIADGSAWWLVYKAVPGAGAIRAAFRFQHVIAFALGFVVAVALDVRSIGGRRFVWLRALPGSRLGQVAMLGLIALDQFNWGNYYFASRKFLDATVARIAAPPPECRMFFVTSAGTDATPGYAVNTLTMLVAQKLALPTINGYTSGPPPGWALMDPGSDGYLTSVVAWLDLNGIKRGVCQLEFGSGRWSLFDADRVTRPVRLQAPLADSDYRVEFNLPDGIAAMKAGETRKVRIAVRNLGGATLSGLGSPDSRYAVLLSYQWVDARGASEGYNYRKALPFPVGPGESVVMTIDVVAPSKPGRYTLQLDLVQELIAWFHNKGGHEFSLEVEVN
jgi:hypothetical protein